MLDALVAALSLPILAMTSGACTGPTITNAVATHAGNNGNLTSYDVRVTVRNEGTRSEPSSLLQSVLVYQDATKVDQKGTPPLAAGSSVTVHYRFSRSSEAAAGSTHLRFQLALADPHSTSFPVCTTAGNRYRLDI